MIALLGRLAFSFLITNWLYAESTLLYPPFEQFAQSVYRAVRLPTHEEWPEIAAQNQVVSLTQEMDKAFEGFRKRTGLSLVLFDPTLRDLWQTTFYGADKKTESTKSFAGEEDFFDSFDPDQAGFRELS